MVIEIHLTKHAVDQANERHPQHLHGLAESLSGGVRSYLGNYNGHTYRYIVTADSFALPLDETEPVNAKDEGAQDRIQQRIQREDVLRQANVEQHLQSHTGADNSCRLRGKVGDILMLVGIILGAVVILAQGSTLQLPSELLMVIIPIVACMGVVLRFQKKRHVSRMMRREASAFRVIRIVLTILLLPYLIFGVGYLVLGILFAILCRCFPLPDGGLADALDPFRSVWLLTVFVLLVVVPLIPRCGECGRTVLSPVREGGISWICWGCGARNIS